MADAYTHPLGWNDYVNFPTDPANEAAARALLQQQHDEILTFHNNHSANNAIDAHGIIPACSVTNSSNISIANNAGTFLAFNAEQFDTNSIHDDVTNNTRLTAKTAGKYQITAFVNFESNATGVREVDITDKVTSAIAGHCTPAISGRGTLITVTTLLDMLVNDFVEVFVTQTSGGALNVIAGSKFQIVRVG